MLTIAVNKKSVEKPTLGCIPIRYIVSILLGHYSWVVKVSEDTGLSDLDAKEVGTLVRNHQFQFGSPNGFQY